MLWTDPCCHGNEIWAILYKSGDNNYMIHVVLIHYILFRPEPDNTCAYVLLRRHVRGKLCCTSDRTWPRTLCDYCEPCMYKCRCPDRTPPCAELIEVFPVNRSRLSHRPSFKRFEHFDQLCARWRSQCSHKVRGQVRSEVQQSSPLT